MNWTRIKSKPTINILITDPLKPTNISKRLKKYQVYVYKPSKFSKLINSYRWTDRQTNKYRAPMTELKFRHGSQTS